MPAHIVISAPTPDELAAMRFPPPGHDWVLVIITGNHAELKMMLPTGRLTDLEGSGTYWLEWIIVIQGPVLAGTGATPDQRKLLLDLVLAYKIFADGHPAVNPDHYAVLTAKIVEIATSPLGTRSVEERLREVSVLAHKLIPLAIWGLYTLPPPPEYPSELYEFPT